jgi:tryptophan 2,3-dioxygenase
MTPDEPMTYDSYLRLDALLTIQRPLTPADLPVTRAAERFFIVCHQASELWQSQLLVDLEQAATQAERRDWPGVRTSLTRVTSISLLLTAHLEQFFTLPREHFLAFRLGLAGASGAGSKQFRELLLGSRQRHVRFLRLRLSDEPARGASAGHATCDHARCGAARALETFIGSVTDWRTLHLKIAEHFIHDLPGTGGTSGGAYLRRRLADSTETAVIRVCPVIPAGYGRYLSTSER